MAPSREPEQGGGEAAMQGKTFVSMMFFLLVALFGSLPQGLRAHTGVNSLTLTAQAMGCDVKTVQDIQAMDLDCTLAWILMRLCATSDAQASRLMDERGSRSWGEVCALHGKDWGSLVQEVIQRKRAFGLVLEATSNRKALRSASNHPDSPELSVVHPGAKP